LGERAPCDLDDTAVNGIVGHPAFCVTLEWPVTLMLREETILGISRQEMLRGVHAAQDSTFHRLVSPISLLRSKELGR
jgi:hypothetical protein